MEHDTSSPSTFSIFLLCYSFSSNKLPAYAALQQNPFVCVYFLFFFFPIPNNPEKRARPDSIHLLFELISIQTSNLLLSPPILCPFFSTALPCFLLYLSISLSPSPSLALPLSISLSLSLSVFPYRTAQQCCLESSLRPRDHTIFRALFVCLCSPVKKPPSIVPLALVHNCAKFHHTNAGRAYHIKYTHTHSHPLIGFCVKTKNSQSKRRVVFCR